jgi:Zn-dependent peptidase ImmA (M78 family)
MTSSEWRAIDGDTRGKLTQHLREAPVSLSAIAQSLGVKVVSSVLPNGISGEIRPDESTDSGFIIRVNKNDPARRQRFTVAHELAHFLLHRDMIGNGVTDDVLYRSTLSDSREAQANRLAADLLMPRTLVDEWIERARSLRVEDDPVEFLSDKFGVSTAAMKIRLGIK